jgi:hypothetical protein
MNWYLSTIYVRTEWNMLQNYFTWTVLQFRKTCARYLLSLSSILEILPFPTTNKCWMFDTTQSSRVKGMCASHKVKVARENKRGMKTLSNQGSQHSSNLMLSQYHRTTQPFGSPQTKQRYAPNFWESQSQNSKVEMWPTGLKIK